MVDATSMDAATWNSSAVPTAANAALRYLGFFPPSFDVPSICFSMYNNHGIKMRVIHILGFTFPVVFLVFWVDFVSYLQYRCDFELFFYVEYLIMWFLTGVDRIRQSRGSLSGTLWSRQLLGMFRKPVFMIVWSFSWVNFSFMFQCCMFWVVILMFVFWYRIHSS